MTQVEFLENFKDILQTDADITFDMLLEDIEEWDSLAKLSCAAFFDTEFGIKVSFADFEAMKTVADLAKKAGII